MELKITVWDQPTPPTEEAIRELLSELELKIYHWTSGPEDVYAGHTHGYHKVLYVVKGSIKFDLPTRHRMFTLNSGDRLDLPGGIRHSAVVGPDGVTCMEAHIY